MLIQLTYVSQASNPMSIMDVTAILKVSRLHNAALGITGALCMYKDIFLQQLEGDESRVHALYQRIIADTRHRDARVVDEAEILQRRFGHWAMGLVTENKDNHDLFSTHLPAAPFAPCALDATLLRALFSKIVNHARWIQ